MPDGVAHFPGWDQAGVPSVALTVAVTTGLVARTTMRDGETVAVVDGVRFVEASLGYPREWRAREQRFGVPATARASLAFYNTKEEVDALIRAIHKVIEVFG